MQHQKRPAPNPPPGKWRRATQTHTQRFTEEQLEDVAYELEIDDSAGKAWLADLLEHLSDQYAWEKANMDKPPWRAQLQQVLEPLHRSAAALREAFEKLAASRHYFARIQKQAALDPTFEPPDTFKLRDLTAALNDFWQLQSEAALDPTSEPPDPSELNDLLDAHRRWCQQGDERFIAAGDWVERIESWAKQALHECEAEPSGRGGRKEPTVLPLLTLALADIYLQLTGRDPVTSTTKRSDKRGGPFVRFASTVFKILDPEAYANRSDPEQTIRNILKNPDQYDRWYLDPALGIDSPRFGISLT